MTGRGQTHARRLLHGVWPLILVLFALSACERATDPESRPPPRTAPVRTQNPLDPAASPSKSSAGPVILVLGDSLAAGFGVRPEQSFPALLQARLRAAGLPHQVVNAGVSGDTTAGGLARLDWLFRQRIDWMIVELGANDGLRGQNLKAMQANLAAIIEKAKARGIAVLLAGMRMPDNYGPAYTAQFQAIYPELARTYRVPLIPFLLEGVALRPELNQADGIHPTPEGAKIVADNVWKVLQPLLGKQGPLSGN